MTKKPTYQELEQRVERLEKEVLECRRSEKALRESEESYRIIMAAAPDAITITRIEDTRYLEVNDAFCRLTGYSREEAIGKTSFDLNLLVNLSDRKRLLDKIREKGETTDFDMQYRMRDGTIHDTIMSAKPLTYKGEECLIAITTIITERKRAEDALRKREKLLNMSQAIGHIGSWEMDVVANHLTWSDEVYRMFGLRDQEFDATYEAFLETVHPDDRACVDAAYSSSLRKGLDTYEIEHRIIRHDSAEIRIVHEKCEHIKDDSGRIIRSIGMVQDITERKMAEEALQQSEERYRSLVENTMDGYFICEIPSGRFLFLNQRSCDLYGYTMQEGLKLTVWDVMSYRDHDRIRGRIQSRLEGEKLSNERQTYTAVRKDGSTFRVEISTSLVSFEGVHAIQGVLRDITEQERLEVQLMNAQKMEAIGTLAGGIAHDFNNLLMGIQGNASLMLLDVDFRHPHHEKLKSIEQYVQSGTELTKQLLGFARGGKYEVKPTDLNELIEESARMFGRTRKDIQIRKKLKEDLWVAEVDQGQMEQVLLNLYVNAWQAMPGGGELFLQTENVVLDEDYVKPFDIPAGTYVKISVTDTGIGMDEATQKRVFDPFFTTKGMGRGTGLGLASAYGIIKNHGGLINVYSEQGEGTTFNIYLPSSEKEVVEGKDLEEDIVKGTETVLLVDDEPMILDVGTQLLNRLGYKVMAARSGREALDIYERNKDTVSLVILDMIMPDMSGGETYDELKKINPSIKVLLASGYSINGQAQAILDRGCDAFIQKPFNLQELSRKARAVLDEK